MEKKFLDSGPDTVSQASEKLLLSRYVPASLVIDSYYKILRFHGPVQKYLQPVSGKASLSALNMLPEELSLGLQGLVQQWSKKSKGSIKTDIALYREDILATITLEVAALPTTGKEKYYLVVLKEKGEPAFWETPDVSSSLQQGTGADWLHLQAQLNTLQEEYNISREEWQAAQEELTASYEEAQQLNQALTKNKQELQVAVKELMLANENIETQNSSLSENSNLSFTLLEALRDPVVLLNINLSVHAANKAFYHTFHLTPADTEGRFLYEIGHSRWNVPELLAKLSEVVSKKKGFTSFEVPSAEGLILQFNAIHLENGSKRNDRILISMQDITQHRQAREAKEWLAAVVEASNEGIISFTTNKTIISWNKGAEKIFGYTEVEMAGKSITRLVRQGDKLAQHKLIERVMKGEVVRQLEMEHLHKDGHPIFVSTSIALIKDAQGHIKGLMASVQDITERKAAAEALKMAKNSLQMAQEAANMGSWEMNLATGQILYHNLRNDQLMGYSVWQPDWNMAIARHHVLEEDKPMFDEAMTRMMTTGHLSMEVRTRWPDGSIHWIYKAGQITYDAAGKPLRAAGIGMDITDRKLAEQRKEALLGIASHELKTPVTSIKAYAQILQERFVEAEDYNSALLLTKLDRQVDKLTNLIRALLDSACLTEGELHLKQQIIDLNVLMQEVVADVQPEISSHKIVKKLRPLPAIQADKDRMRQVLTNLLTNAIQYSPQSNKIVICSECDGRQVTVQVQDYGIGIPQPMQQQVFERFFRVRETQMQNAHGLGLGLFISAGIIHCHGGKIGVESTVGKGSKFWFTLPVK